MGRSKQRDNNKNNSNQDDDPSEADAAAGGITQQERHKAISKRRATSETLAVVKLTRRQKRQKLNEKNQWPQHPKIRNPEQRAKAYLRVAGVEPVQEHEEESSNEQKKPDDDNTKATTSSSSSSNGTMSEEDWRRFGRFLGGTDQRTRHKAVQKLQAFLKAKCQPPLPEEEEEEEDNGSGQEENQGELQGSSSPATGSSPIFGLSELDLMKLWKGLWYTLYMADKAPVQDELAKHISKLIWALQGTPGEDEFAAEAYLDVTEGASEFAECASSDDEDSGDDDPKEMDPSEMMQRIIAAYGEDKGEGDEENDTSDSDNDVQILDETFVPFEEDQSESSDCNNGGDNEMEEEDGEDEQDDSLVPHCRGAHLASLFFRTGLVTMRREWGNMDKYRIDKFYTLLRYMLREVYTYMSLRHWNLGILRLFHDALYEEILTQRPNGLRYHILDICLEEVARVSQHESTALPLTEAAFLDWLEPFVAVAQNGGANEREGVQGDPTVHKRVVEQVLNKFALEYSVVAEAQDHDNNSNDDKKHPKPVLDQVHVGTVADFLLEVGGDGSTLDCFRKSLYDVVKTFKRQLKTGPDVDLSPTQHEEEDDEDHYEGAFTTEALQQDQDEGPQVTEDEVATTESKKKRTKKKKKKEKKGQSKDDEVSRIVTVNPAKANKTDDIRQDDEDNGAKNDSPAKKRKRNRKKKREAEERDPYDINDGEVLTISVADQKQAKSAMKKLRQSQPEQDTSELAPHQRKKRSKEEREAEEERKRRVRFDQNNRARSWKASMAGLRKLKPGCLKKKSPEKGILLNKGKIGTAQRKTQPRKRAVDYF